MTGISDKAISEWLETQGIFPEARAIDAARRMLIELEPSIKERVTDSLRISELIVERQIREGVTVANRVTKLPRARISHNWAVKRDTC